MSVQKDSFASYTTGVGYSPSEMYVSSLSLPGSPYLHPSERVSSGIYSTTHYIAPSSFGASSSGILSSPTASSFSYRPNSTPSTIGRSVSIFSSNSSKSIKVGRGGLGNSLQTAQLDTDCVNYEEILQKRRAKSLLNPRAKVSTTGRGGAGNIKATVKAVPFDPSKDPDDDYERIVQAEAQQRNRNKPVVTGRGGSGNMAGARPRANSLSALSKKKGKVVQPQQPSPLSLETSSPHNPDFPLSPESYNAPYQSPLSPASSNATYQSPLSPARSNAPYQSPLSPASSNAPYQSPRTPTTPTISDPFCSASINTLPSESNCSREVKKRPWWKRVTKLGTRTKPEVQFVLVEPQFALVEPNIALYDPALQADAFSKIHGRRPNIDVYAHGFSGIGASRIVEEDRKLTRSHILSQKGRLGMSQLNDSEVHFQSIPQRNFDSKSYRSGMGREGNEVESVEEVQWMTGYREEEEECYQYEKEVGNSFLDF